jgi:hypothetical protein
MSGVRLEDGQAVRRAASFLRPQLVQTNDLPTGPECEVDERGRVVTGPNGATSVAGLWVVRHAASP